MSLEERTALSARIRECLGANVWRLEADFECLAQWILISLELELRQLDWLASELQGSILSIIQSWCYKRVPLCPPSYVSAGIQTQDLMLVWQAPHWLNHLLVMEKDKSNVFSRKTVFRSSTIMALAFWFKSSSI